MIDQADVVALDTSPLKVEHAAFVEYSHRSLAFPDKLVFEAGTLAESPPWKQVKNFSFILGRFINNLSRFVIF